MITIQASANEFIIGKKPAEEMIMDGNDDAMGYLADALAGIALIVAYAEKEYGPIVTDLLLNSMERGTLRETIKKEREKRK